MLLIPSASVDFKQKGRLNTPHALCVVNAGVVMCFFALKAPFLALIHTNAHEHTSAVCLHVSYCIRCNTHTHTHSHTLTHTRDMHNYRHMHMLRYVDKARTHPFLLTLLLRCQPTQMPCQSVWCCRRRWQRKSTCTSACSASRKPSTSLFLSFMVLRFWPF